MSGKKDNSTIITQILEESAQVKLAIGRSQAATIKNIIDVIVETFKRGGKVVLFGNGGSAADAQHLAGELVGRLKLERKALPAIALNTNTSILTAMGNDYGYSTVFSRQVEALVNAHDVVIAISTSGNSPNVIEAVEKARDKGAVTIGLTGGTGGRLTGAAEISLIVPSSDTQRIQEAHITIGHIICELVEKELFSS